MSSLAAIQSVSRRLGAPGLAAVGAGALALLIFVLSSEGLVGALTLRSAKVEQAEQEKEKSRTEFAGAFDGFIKQTNGRSLFFKPGPPPVKEVVKIDDNPKPPPPPSAPTSYGGPSLIAMVNGTAWFGDGKRLGPGEGDSELKIVELRPPWGAVVKWKNVEFTIGLFERDGVVYPAPKPAGSTTSSSAAPSPGATEAMMGPEAPPDAFEPEKPEPKVSDPKPPRDANGPATPPPAPPPLPPPSTEAPEPGSAAEPEPTPAPHENP